LWKRAKEEVSLEAVIGGAIADHVLTTVLVLLISAPFFFMLFKLPTRLTDTEFLTSFTTYMESSQYFLVLSTLLGGIASIFGGYLAASLAKRSELLNGFIAGVVSLLDVGAANIYYFLFDSKYVQFIHALRSLGDLYQYAEIIAVIVTPLLG